MVHLRGGAGATRRPSNISSALASIYPDAACPYGRYSGQALLRSRR